MSDATLSNEQLIEIAEHGTLDGIDVAKPRGDQTSVCISKPQIADLRLLAARAEASVDRSLSGAAYASTRLTQFVHDIKSNRVGASSPAFHTFAISAGGRDVMLCRTPEIAKFIVALLNFGGMVVAECGIPDKPA